MDSSTLVVLAATFLFYATISRRVRDTPITAPIVFVGAGFLFGPEGFGWLHLTLDDHAVSTLAEAALVVVLFSDASRVDLRALRREVSIPARLLGVGLPLTIVAGCLAGAMLFHDLTWAEAAVLAIVLAPTDAALGQAVVSDESLPSRIRQGLNVESGLNDGLCVPLLAIALAITETEADRLHAGDALRLVVEAIGWGVVGGVVAGTIAALALRIGRSRRWMEGHWAQVVPVVGAVGSFAIADGRGGSGFIAAFVGGLVFGSVGRPDAQIAAFSEELGSVLGGLTLIVFGAVVLGALVVAHRPPRRRVRGVEPHGGADGARGDRDVGLAGARSHRSLPRVVRPPRTCVHRVRRHRCRGCGTPSLLGDDRRHHHHRRLECRRARAQRGSARSPLCVVACRAEPGDGKCTYCRAAVASRAAAHAVNPYHPDRVAAGRPTAVRLSTCDSMQRSSLPSASRLRPPGAATTLTR